jgi:outer membrane protein
MDPHANRWLAGIALACLLSAAPALAQAPGSTDYKIGFVSTDRVMRESRVSQQMQKALNADFEKRRQDIEGGPKTELAWRRNSLNDDMNQRRDEAMKKFVDRTNVVIKRIAEAENIDVVFFEAAYATPRIDITERVIRALDAERP